MGVVSDGPPGGDRDELAEGRGVVVGRRTHATVEVGPGHPDPERGGPDLHAYGRVARHRFTVDARRVSAHHPAKIVRTAPITPKAIAPG
jgi:hypothetical protein